MNKPLLLVVEPDEHYISHVAKTAKTRGLISDFIPVTRDKFAEVLDKLDKTKLIIAKGMLETADFLRPILKYNDKELIRKDENGVGLLSHCFILWKKRMFKSYKPLIITDAAMNIAPTAEQKVKIAQVAISLARKLLGVARPVVSILTPSGKLNPAIKSSVDGDFVIQNLANENAEIRLDQMDTAISMDARRIKHLNGGVADILLAETLDSGNNIFKLYTMSGGYSAAGLVCGTTVPVILNSRSDTPKSKLLSIKMASRLMK
jgi:phosphate butyryltransferase